VNRGDEVVSPEGEGDGNGTKRVTIVDMMGTNAALCRAARSPNVHGKNLTRFSVDGIFSTPRADAAHVLQDRIKGDPFGGRPERRLRRSGARRALGILQRREQRAWLLLP